jgi:putative ABC transport system permease protein
VLKNYLVVALRSIARNKSYSLVNIACLALGMACVIIISLWVQNELSYDSFHVNADRLHRVVITTEQQDFHGYYMPGLLAEFLKAEYPAIIDATNFRDMGAESKIAHGDASLLKAGAFVDPSFLRMFSFDLISGHPDSVFASPLSIVITEDLARTMFADEDPMGQVIEIEDQVELMVTGVLEDIPGNTHLKFDFLLSFQLAPPHMKKWDNKAVFTYVLLHEGSSYQEVGEKIAGVYNDHNPGAFPNYLYLQPITESRLNNLEAITRGEASIVTYVYILMAVAVAILLIACINFMNLSTAHWRIRAKEIAIRKVVGSSRVQLVRQFLTESILLSFLALVIAVLLAEMLLPAINNILGVHLELSLSLTRILGMVGLAVVTGVMAGSYPALLLSSFRPIAMFQRRVFLMSKPSGKNNRRGAIVLRGLSPRKVLVVCQFALSIVLIIAVVVLGEQLDYVNGMDLGYAKDEIVVLRLHGETARQWQAVKTELLKQPDVESISLSLSGHTGWSESCGIDWDGKQPGDEFDVGINRVDYDYARTFKMEMAAGRFFSAEFPSDRTEAFVVNEAAVKAMGMQDPVGKVISMPALRRTGPIIGVIRDYHTESLRKQVRPFLLIPSEWFGYMNIRIKSGNVNQTLGRIEQGLRAIVPDDPFSYSFLSQDLASSYQAEQRTSQLVRYMTALAILISCLGLYGLASYSIERRTREIAVRKTFGASVSELVRLISWEFVILVAVASVLGWPVAYYAMNRWLEGFAYRISIDFGGPLLAAGLTLIVVLMTVSVRAVRAAMANPIDMLRHE